MGLDKVFVVLVSGCLAFVVLSVPVQNAIDSHREEKITSIEQKTEVIATETDAILTGASSDLPTTTLRERLAEQDAQWKMAVVGLGIIAPFLLASGVLLFASQFSARHNHYLHQKLELKQQLRDRLREQSQEAYEQTYTDAAYRPEYGEGYEEEDYYHGYWNERTGTD